MDLTKYYQIVKCFRDEDLRADRQPEFTQVDIEMSFRSRRCDAKWGEKMLKKLLKKLKALKLRVFPRMTYKEAMRRYGSDKPDTRFLKWN